MPPKNLIKKEKTPEKKLRSLWNLGTHAGSFVIIYFRERVHKCSVNA